MDDDNLVVRTWPAAFNNDMDDNDSSNYITATQS